jgi:hypothetical protein
MWCASPRVTHLDGAPNHRFYHRTLRPKGIRKYDPKKPQGVALLQKTGRLHVDGTPRWGRRFAAGRYGEQRDARQGITVRSDTMHAPGR